MAILKLAVLTSGGDVPGLNACLRAVVRSAIHHKMQIIGVQHGFDGLIKGQFVGLNATSVSNIIHLGGTILKSSRSEEFKKKEGRRQAYENLIAQGVEALVVIGGDGSLRGASVFTEEYDIPILGIPKTIDNDISGTDVCIGYDTALNTAMQAIDKIRDSAESHERVFVVEVMGRESGYIAYGAGLAGGAEAILVPESNADLARLEERLKEGWEREKKSIIIVVAEGDEAGGAKQVKALIEKHMPGKYVGHCVLGHTQRGGSPTSADRILSARLGVAAVKALSSGKKNQMVGMLKGDIHFTPLSEIKRHHMPLTHEVLGLLDELAS
jgi:6-phosphofructokinase 1